MVSRRRILLGTLGIAGALAIGWSAMPPRQRLRTSQPLHSNPLTEVDRRANRRVSLRVAPLGTPRGS